MGGVDQNQQLASYGSRVAEMVGAHRVTHHPWGIAVNPTETEHVATAMRLANAERIPVEIVGGGSKTFNRHDPNRAPIQISTAGLGSFREHVWQDLTCTVQAGCTWETMQGTLAQHGQFVALDPRFADRATVGGIIATNESGSLRLKYGGLRDLVIGMTIVLADGTIARSGGKVVKNVAGYDLHKLMIGAQGTLGVITEVTFRLHATPRHTRSFTFSSPTPETPGELLLSILNSHLNIQAMQLRNSQVGFHLDVQLAALPEVIGQQADVLTSMANHLQLGLRDASADVWMTSHTLSAQLGIPSVKATMLPTQIPSIMAAIQALGGAAVIQATGIMSAYLPINVTAILRLRAQLEEAGGSLTILSGAPEGADRWGKLPDSMDLMRRIKHQFDPNKILNPGRFIGGI